MTPLYRTRQAVIVLAYFFSASLGPAASTYAREKFPLPNLFQLIGRAQVVVIGKVTAVESGTYQLEVEEAIRGRQEKRMTILQIRDSCHQRPFDYAVNQRLIVLLSALTNGQLKPVAPYGGESIIEGGQVDCYVIEPGSHVALADLKSAIVDYPELLQPPVTPPPPLVKGFRPRQTVKPRSFASRSPIHQLLAVQAKAAEN